MARLPERREFSVPGKYSAACWCCSASRVYCNIGVLVLRPDISLARRRCSTVRCLDGETTCRHEALAILSKTLRLRDQQEITLPCAERPAFLQEQSERRVQRRRFGCTRTELTHVVACAGPVSKDGPGFFGREPYHGLISVGAIIYGSTRVCQKTGTVRQGALHAV